MNSSFSAMLRSNSFIANIMLLVFLMYAPVILSRIFRPWSTRGLFGCEPNLIISGVRSRILSAKQHIKFNICSSSVASTSNSSRSFIRIVSLTSFGSVATVFEIVAGKVFEMGEEKMLPKWLSSLLSEKFYDGCVVHHDVRKNEKNIFCVDCCVGFCAHCVNPHGTHRLLQIRRYVYHDVLRVNDAEKLMDCSNIQSNFTNGAYVVFLNQRPQTRYLKGMNVDTVSYLLDCPKSALLLPFLVGNEDGSVCSLLKKRILDVHDSQFVSDVREPLEIEELMDRDVGKVIRNVGTKKFVPNREKMLRKQLDQICCCMEDSLEDNSQHKKTKSRVGWKNISVVKTFIEACIHAIALDGREGVSLKVLSWKKVAKALKDNHNFEADQKQMRNHLDYMKLKYGAWLFLKNRTGNIYDDSTNTFNLTEEEWELEIMKNKNVKPLKTTVLHFPELCAQLFDGTMATGIKGGGPSSHEPVYVGEPHMVDDADATKVPYTESSKATSKAPCAVKNKRKRRQPTDGVEEEILGVLKVIAEKIVESEPPRKLKPPTLRLPR
ncbi:Myb/SANT-like domain-containing protein [Tanacetum coccineum]